MKFDDAFSPGRALKHGAEALQRAPAAEHWAVPREGG